MKKIILLFAIVLCSCSAPEDCAVEINKLQELRAAGYRNCNGSHVCVAKIEAEYNNKIKALDCN